MKQRVHDYIVLGASLPGVVFAIKKSLAGHSVLLTNMYGFPGGSITESLNCLQEANEHDVLGIARKVHEGISRDMLQRSVVNPESLKFILQHMLETSAVDLHFHVLPKKITITEGGSTEITLLAKEGQTVVLGNKVIDASETYEGAALLGRKRTVVERSVNVFISRPADDHFLAWERISQAVELSDGRYWISLRHDAHDDLFAENETQTLLDACEAILERSGSRIQVFPLHAHTIVDVEKPTALPGLFTTIDDILGSSVRSSHQFVKASMIERAHDTF
jgi:hypothetical protein